MKVGYFVSPQYRPEEDLAPALGDMIGHVRAARDAGCASIWVPHHFITAPMRMFQPHVLLARLAAEIEDMQMGPAILLLPMLNPVLVAEETATLDRISGGNFVLAVGMGYRPEEFAVAGVPFKQRAGRLEEAIALIRRLWREERVTFHGRYYTVEDIGLGMHPVSPEGCPIWVGGSVPPAVERAARIGDAWIASFSQTRGELVGLAETYRAARKAAGLAPPPTQPLCRECFIGASGESALADCRAALLYKYEAYASWGNANVGASEFAARFDGFMKDRFVVGDTAQVIDELQRYRDEIGADHLILRMQWPGMDPEQVLASARRLEKVIAAL
jgi:alkanesulfonate monooxygenase SsuD/methylene tetrahydromethanopterin reductase-like flavin-dependent oxidoreductase (luciferase family)